MLYSAQEFLKLLAGKPILAKDFVSVFPTYCVASGAHVLRVSQECCWVSLAEDGVVSVASAGKQVLSGADEAQMLRYQLRDVIRVYQPPWAFKMRHGRAETKGFVPPEIQQCMEEAGLFAKWSDDSREWWDEIAQAARARRSDEMLKIGREAERLSFKRELERTGVEPHWQSLESNFSGYDILSRFSRNNSKPVKIEVKGSAQHKSEAFFYVTRNEWRTAELSPDYRFHLWLLRGEPRLAEVPAKVIADHLPDDCGRGAWETVRLPFSEFH
jgi:hypothetical protein